MAKLALYLNVFVPKRYVPALVDYKPPNIYESILFNDRTDHITHTQASPPIFQILFPPML